MRSVLNMGAKLTRIEDLFGGILNGIPANKFTDFQTYLSAGTRKLWAVFKGCDAVAKVVMDTPLTLRKIGGDGSAVKHKELDRLLKVPNQGETWGEMLFKIVFHLKLTGNAFIAKDEVNLKGDRPTSLFLLNPKRIKLVIDPKVGVIGYTYTTQDGLVIPYDAAEIIHFRIPHADNDYWGLGEIESAEPLFNDAINRDTWKEKFWVNGASPSGLLICEDNITDATAWKKAKADWNKEYGGAGNAGKTAWLTGKWKHQQLGLTAQEMQDIEQGKWTIEQIFMQLGVPLSVAGVRDAANYATAQIDDLRFRRYTIKPLCKFIADTLTSDLVAGYDVTLELVFQIAGLTDIANVTDHFVPLFDRGIVSLNEMRVLAGLQPKADDPVFDEHYIMSALLPLSLAGVVDQGQTQEAAKGITSRFVQLSISGKRKLT